MKLDLKLYRGYVNDRELVVFGHLFRSWAPDQYLVEKKGIRHAVSIVHMFRIKPLKNIPITLKFKGLQVTTKTLDDGFFRFNLPYQEPLDSGWHSYTVSCKIEDFGIIEKEEILKPFKGELGVISDIDDTFLVSHSSNFFKKLYVLLLRNMDRRKIFKDVEKHYQALSTGKQDDEDCKNLFFYVSSSEWNLYEFIDSIMRKYKMPKGILKLKDIKSGISDFLFTGGGNHDHKFEKIKDIISFYPELGFVLLGDDSQQDPFLYERIVKIFPLSISAIYIRQTRSQKKSVVERTLKNIESLGVSTCYFKNSGDAILHSKRIGIIAKEKVTG